MSECIDVMTSEAPKRSETSHELRSDHGRWDAKCRSNGALKLHTLIANGRRRCIPIRRWITRAAKAECIGAVELLRVGQ